MEGNNILDSHLAPFVDGGLVGYNGAKITIAAYTIIIAVGLVLTHFIIFTQFRLWHTNWLLSKIPVIVGNPISQILTQGVGLIAVIPYRNDLYLIWLVVLLIAYDNVFTVSGFALFENGLNRMAREYLFLTNCVFIGVLVTSYNKENTSAYYRPLLALWSLVLLKFIVRILSYRASERAYGIKNTNLVADYMETEHKLSDYPDPQSMTGYKYLVIGEKELKPHIDPESYTLQFESTKEVITVERIWECKNELLDQDERIRDVCLSFALVKLLRRRFFGFRAAESQDYKTKEFVFRGLLSRVKKENVFRVIRMELEFLRDFFYTRYPVVFAFGAPVFNVLVLIAMLAISLWIATEAFQEKKHSSKVYNYLIVNGVNVDYRITNGLLIIIMMMEIFEVLSYVFSDWLKVTLICRHVRSKKEEKFPFIYKMLGLFFTPKLSKSLKNTIGQYSLLKNCNVKSSWTRLGNNCLYHTTHATLASKMPRWIQGDKAIFLSEEVKVAIFDALKESDEGNSLANRLAPLENNKIDCKDFSWLANLPTPLHTIMVWHIATSLCEIRPLMNQPLIDDTNSLVSRIANHLPSCLRKRVTREEEEIKAHHLVASSLSKYCAHLVVFEPDLLPTSTYSSKLIFKKIVLQASKFFEAAKSPKEQYELVMESNQNPYQDKKIIHLGAKLARCLMEQIPDDVMRWKVMAEAWSQLILVLAPGGYTNAHLEKLASGGEFITHLWALLYHAGITHSVSEDFNV
ncbi:hypothetical protein LUZ60_016282 [Juncus effusus]|nr:hypothetical protein LUZ60_016282 [Juncus effusus]